MKYFHRTVLICAVLTAVSITADAQKTYSDCCTNFTVLENALLETSDNMFQLTTTYYHPDEEHPLYVDVCYNFIDSSNEMHYVWSVSTLYFIVQPLPLACLSQFYSPIADHRISSLTLKLPKECTNLTKVRGSSKKNFLFVLTQRVINILLCYIKAA